MKIHSAILAGVTQRFGEVFGLTANQLLLTTQTTKVQVLADKAKASGVEPKLPRAFLTPTGFGVTDESGYRARPFSNMGVYYAGTDDGNSLRRKHLIPVTFHIGVVFHTNQLNDALEFSATWFSQVVTQRRLSFQLEMGGITIDIQCSNASTDIQIPELDVTVENPNAYMELTGEFSIQGFMEADAPDDNSVVPIIKSNILNVTTA